MLVLEAELAGSPPQIQDPLSLAWSLWLRSSCPAREATFLSSPVGCMQGAVYHFQAEGSRAGCPFLSVCPCLLAEQGVRDLTGWQSLRREGAWALSGHIAGHPNGNTCAGL